MRHVARYIVLLVLSPNFVFAQQKEIDSVLSVIKQGNLKDSAVVRSYLLLSNTYSLKGDLSDAITFDDSALHFAQKSGYKHGIMEAYNGLGNNFLQMGQADKALDYDQKALNIAHQTHDRSSEASIMGNLGNVYEQQGSFLHALDYFNKALAEYQAIGEKYGAAINSNNIGIINAEQGNFPKAIDYFFKALQLYQDINNKAGIAQVTGNIGIIYNDEGEYNKSLDYYLEALKINKEVGDKNGIATNTGNIGSIYNHLNNPGKALVYLNEALKLSEDMGNKHLQINNLTNIGNTYRHMGKDVYMGYYAKALKLAQESGSKSSIEKILGCMGEGYADEKKYTEAAKYFTQSLEIAREIGDLGMVMDLNADLSGAYEHNKDWRKAFDSYKQYSTFKDSLLSGEKSKEIGKLEARSEYDKQVALQKADEEKRSALAAAESKRQNIVISFITAVAIAIAIIALTIFRVLSTTRKQKKQIELQKVVVEEQKILVEEKNKEVLDSISYAKRLQDAILPPLESFRKSIPNSFVFYKPKDIVAGDFYWMHSLPILTGEGQGEVSFIASADCTGHGVPGAMISVVCSNALNRAVKEFGLSDTGKILDKVRELVVETFEKSGRKVKDGMDISLLAIPGPTPALPAREGDLEGVLRVRWSGASIPLILVHNGSVLGVAPDKQHIGIEENPKPFTSHMLETKKGDMLYLFTDGFWGQLNPDGEIFSYERFKELLITCSKMKVEDQQAELSKTFDSWKGDTEQTDDVCVIGIRV
jgi:tetratricopeptide (TPR) repeat protein